jgi:hypothetical protein
MEKPGIAESRALGQILLSIGLSTLCGALGRAARRCVGHKMSLDEAGMGHVLFPKLKKKEFFLCDPPGVSGLGLDRKTPPPPGHQTVIVIEWR